MHRGAQYPRSSPQSVWRSRQASHAVHCMQECTAERPVPGSRQRLGRHQSPSRRSEQGTSTAARAGELGKKRAGVGGSTQPPQNGMYRGGRGVAGIEPTTSRTRSENHTTRPNSLGKNPMHRDLFKNNPSLTHISNCQSFLAQTARSTRNTPSNRKQVARQEPGRAAGGRRSTQQITRDVQQWMPVPHTRPVRKEPLQQICCRPFDCSYARLCRRVRGRRAAGPQPM